jgi:isochorismate synthase
LPFPSPIDFKSCLQVAAAHWNAQLPFALFRLPHESAVYAVMQDSRELKDVAHWDAPGFVFAPYDAQAHPTVCLTPDRFYRCNHIPDALTLEQPELPKHPDQKEAHLRLVSKGLEAIQNGRLQKVVLARSIDVLSPLSGFAVFENLLRGYAGAFCYLFFHPATGLWAGASPELLLSHQGATAHTMSLAGTLPATGPNPPHWSPKEIWEQQVVTDYICSRLREQDLMPVAGIAAGVRAGTLWHLKTPISVQVTAKRRAALIRALHPTPAVCGFPLGAAKAFIAAAEKLDRKYYSGFLGPLGLIATEKLELFVNLRCAALHETRATVYVGGGITFGSLPELEWEETQQKTGTMLAALNYSECK